MMVSVPVGPYLSPVVLGMGQPVYGQQMLQPAMVYGAHAQPAMVYVPPGMQGLVPLHRLVPLGVPPMGHWPQQLMGDPHGG